LRFAQRSGLLFYVGHSADIETGHAWTLQNRPVKAKITSHQTV
jgi:hypothetical protein